MKLFFKNNRWYSCCLMIFIAWMSIGIFPLVSYEGDSMQIIAGINNMNNTSITFPPAFTYQYGMQPAIYYIVLIFKKSLPFLTCQQWYCLLSSISAIIYLIFTIEFIHHVGKQSRLLLLICAFLIPETAAIAMYPNTTVFAAALSIVGFYLLLRNNYLYVILLCLAPLFRIDVLIIYPVVLSLFLFKGDSIKKSLLESTTLALIVVAINCLIYWMLNSNPFDTLTTYGDYNENGQYASKVVFAAFSFYTLIGVVMIPIGLYMYMAKKSFNLIFIAIVPIFLIHFFFRNTACATKHFLYIVPFVLLLMSPVVKELYDKCKKKSFIGYLGVVLIGLFLVMSFRMDMPMPRKQWLNKSYSSSKLGPVCNILHTDNRNITLGFGCGQLIPTADEWMLSSGNLFYPFYIRNYKNLYLDKVNSQINYFGDNLDGYTFYSFSWEGRFSYLEYWMNQGYSFEFKNDIFYFKKGDQSFKVVYNLYYELEDMMIKSITENKYPNSFVITMHENEEMLMRDVASKGYVRRVAENTYLIP